MGAAFQTPKVFTADYIKNEKHSIYNSLAKAIVEEDKKKVAKLVNRWYSIRNVIGGCEEIDLLVRSVSGMQEPLL
jgi:aspartate/glutamate racemase